MAALLLGVSQLLLYTRQMLSAEMREDIYRRIQRKILHSSMEALGKNDLGGISARYITDVGRILRTFKIKKNVEVTDNGKIII